MAKRRNLTLEDVYKISKQFKSKTEFKHGDRTAYYFAQNSGLFDDITSHMKRPSKKQHFTLDELLDVIKQCQSRNELKSRFGLHYKYINNYHKDLLDDFYGQGKTHKIDLTAIYDEAKKYKTKNEFKHGSNWAYQAATRNNIIEDVCSHMEQKIQVLNDVIYFWNIDGTDIYKIGVTSSHLGESRIYKSKCELQLGINILSIEIVDDARLVESEILRRFTKCPLNYAHSFEGYTELRILNDDEVSEVLNIINRYSNV